MNDPTKPIRKCVCFDTTFEVLRQSGLRTVEEIAKQYGCTTNCGLCKPYIERMLVSGETGFGVELT